MLSDLASFHLLGLAKLAELSYHELVDMHIYELVLRNRHMLGIGVLVTQERHMDRPIYTGKLAHRNKQSQVKVRVYVTHRSTGCS